MQKVIAPPACLGIMGGGQLGRMFALSAKQMGFKVAILEPDVNCPAKYFANYHFCYNYGDWQGLTKLAEVSDVITTEFENVPAKSLAYLANTVAVYPSAENILIAQNRLQEKAFLNHNNIATVPYCAISQLNNIPAVALNMFPAILKTNTLGYDGKGQVYVKNHEELTRAFLSLGQVSCILEKMIDLQLEVSIVVARNSQEIVTYPIAKNIHTNGILDLSIVPSGINFELEQEITTMAKLIIMQLDYIGVLAIEFFVTTDNQILANEIAPRPHNSGHYTIDACVTSQFEQQVRSICNLKLGSTKLTQKAVMLNLLGNVWLGEQIHPHWAELLSKYNNLKLHLYDKLSAKAGRKMGHITLVGDDTSQLMVQAHELKKLLTRD